jgi:hypothetical protein
MNREKIKAAAITALIIGAVVLYVLEFQYFDRILNVRGLVLVSLALGALLGFALARRWRHTAGDSLERFQLHAALVVLCALFMPLLGSLSNRLLSPFPARVETVEFVEESPRIASRFGVIRGEEPVANQYTLFFYRENRLRRIKNQRAHFSEQLRGDSIPLPFRRGLWGYEVVLPLD